MKTTALGRSTPSTVKHDLSAAAAADATAASIAKRCCHSCRDLLLGVASVPRASDNLEFHKVERANFLSFFAPFRSPRRALRSSSLSLVTQITP